jgi:ABC-type bacteriocin/lantibiotic exporter with double-glycine peptidase domain
MRSASENTLPVSDSGTGSPSDSNGADALRKIGAYLPKLAVFALRNFISARWAVAMAVIGVIVEYATLTIMLPLSGSRNIGLGAQVTAFWRSVASALGLPDGTRTWLWLFLLLLGVRILLGLGQVTLNSYVGKRIMGFLCGGAVERVVVHEPLSLIYQRSIGHYLAIAGDEALRVGQIFFNFVQLCSALLAALIGMVALYFFSPLALCLTAIFLLMAAIALLAMTGRLFAASGKAGVLRRQVSTTFVEAINGIRSIRSMAGENFVVGRFVDFIERYTHSLFMLDMFNHVARALPAVFLIAVGLVALYPQAGFFEGVSTLFFFAVVAILTRILSFLGEAVKAGGHLVADVRAAFELEEVVKSAERTTKPPDAGSIDSVREVGFHDLMYAYKVNQPVFSGISGRLAAGNCYALVGRSGSGKSTLADLLLGLLNPQQGELRLNGVAYTMLSMSSLRRRVVLVEQHTRIFSGSILDNITFGLAPTVSEVREAVDCADLEEFIASLPEGLHTQLDYQGANLSGGQRQRIGLARALVRRPDVLILDEATSALDSQTRDAVLENLRDAFRDRILLFITHDANVIKLVDQVWHIRKGKLVVEMNESVLSAR